MPGPAAGASRPARAEPSDGLRESGPARYARTHLDFAWATADTANFRLYVEASSAADRGVTVDWDAIAARGCESSPEAAGRS